jgi:hypothetical protein
MKPRITFAMRKAGGSDVPSICLYLNPAGRDLLVQRLNALNETDEHFHLQAEDWTFDVPLRQIAYGPEEVVLDDVKVLFRLDEWDSEYFPHVMTETPND